jgi:hypothetical protein
VGHERQVPGVGWGYAMDFGACWMTSLHDLYALQNVLWARKKDWNNQQHPNTNWTDANLSTLQ